jgi:hypothetical protein
MGSAAGKSQSGETHRKPKSRPLYWLGAILLFLFVFLTLTSIVPLEFHVGRHAIRIESGLLSAPANTFFEVSRAKWGLSSYGSYTDTTYTFHAGRGFFSVTVQTEDGADPNSAYPEKP